MSISVQTPADTDFMSAFAGRVRERLGLVKASTPRTWVRQIVGGGQITEQCPDWCVSDHLGDERGNLDDLTHSSRITEMFVNTFDHWSNGEPVTMPLPVLRAEIRIDPYSDDPNRSIPFVAFEPAQDDVMDELGPEELAAIVAQLRAHCDELDKVVVALRAARNGHAR